MMATPHHSTPITPEAYLAWEATQETRHESVDGEILAMTGGTIAHNGIAINLLLALRTHV
jgi:Uma2 family endonuclease